MIDEPLKYEEALKTCGVVSVMPKGISMNPFIIQGRDTIVVVAKTDKLKKYDSALYKRRNGSYILHRVIDVTDDGYLISGDNQIAKEHVLEEQVIGVLEGYYKKNKYISCSSKWYKFKIKVWCFLPIKAIGVFTMWFFRRCFGLLKRILKWIGGLFKK